MNAPPRRTLAFGIAVLLTWPQMAEAISARHDTPESLYVARAGGLDAVGSVIGLFTGTLIAPGWVLTAAHGAELVESMVPDETKRVFVLNGTPHRVAAIHLPEGRTPAQPAGKGSNARDIALLRLAEPVPDVKPIRVYDGDESGAEVVIAGAGTWCADGRAGVPFADAAALPRGTLRAGTNRVDSVDTKRQVFEVTFDDPAGGHATRLECGLGVGDSGGPLLLETPGGLAVAGILSQCEPATEGVLGRYGDRIDATRVSAYAEWITRTIAEGSTTSAGAGPSPRAQAAPAQEPFAWPETEAGARAHAYFAALNADDDGPMRAFIPTHWSPEYMEKRPAKEILARHRAPHAQFGVFTPVAVQDSGDWTVTILADAEKAPFRLAFTFELSPEPPHYSVATRVRPAR